jgi:hypothetical protein
MLTSMMMVIYNTFVIVGVLILLISFSSSNVTGMITGYSFIECGVILLVGYFIKLIYENTQGSSITKLTSVLFTIGPFVILIYIILYSIYLLLTYKNRISQGNVAPGYNNFTSISIILILLQLYIFYLGINNNNENDDVIVKKLQMNKVYGILLYFIGILNSITVITIGIILALFNTDG